MVFILPREKTLGASFGEGLSTGITSGLQALANMKMQDMQQSKAINKLLPLFQGPGVTPEQAQAQAYSALVSPSVLPQAMKSRQESAQMAPIVDLVTQLLQGTGGASVPRGVPQGQPGEPSQVALPAGTPTMEIPGELPVSSPATAGTPVMQQATKPMEISPESKAALAAALMTGKPAEIAKVLTGMAKETARTKTAAEVQSRKESAQSSFEQEKSNRAYKKDILATEKTNIKERGRLEKLKALRQKEGAIDSPYLVKVLKKMGLEMLLKPGTVESEKIVADLARRTVTASKGRISEMVFKQYMKSFPNLETSPEAQSAVVDSLLDLIDLENLEAGITKDVIKEKKGLQGYELDELVSDRYGVATDKLIDKMKQKISSASITLEANTQDDLDKILNNPENTGKKVAYQGKTYMLGE